MLAKIAKNMSFLELLCNIKKKTFENLSCHASFRKCKRNKNLQVARYKHFKDKCVTVTRHHNFPRRYRFCNFLLIFELFDAKCL